MPDNVALSQQKYGPAWPFLAASLAAAAVTAIRTVAGAVADLAPIMAVLADTPAAPVVLINWYALSGIMAAFAVALLWAIWLPRGARRAIALLATATFGIVAVTFMGFAWAEAGSPFAFLPWMPLTLTTALCALAAWRA